MYCRGDSFDGWDYGVFVGVKRLLVEFLVRILGGLEIGFEFFIGFSGIGYVLYFRLLYIG